MNLNLADKIAIVTGAASGIGSAISALLIEEGTFVVGGDLDTSSFSKFKRDRFIGVTCDLSTDLGCSKLFTDCMDRFGTVDILINNVGLFPYRSGFLSTSVAEWMHLFDVNFYSMVRMAQNVLPVMQKKHAGSIVSIASDCGRQPDPFLVDYSATKAAIINLSKALSIEFGPSGIRSNVVSPGPIRTKQFESAGGFAEALGKRFNLEKEEAIKYFAREFRKLPTGRVGTPEEVAAVAVLLASDISAQVTGADYTVNGGSLKAA